MFYVGRKRVHPLNCARKLKHRAAMKTFFTLFCLLLIGCLAQAQSTFAKPDSIGEHFDEHFLDLPDLARKLSRPFGSEAEKARVLFAWIAHQIAFDVPQDENPPALGRFVARTEKEMQRILK